MKVPYLVIGFLVLTVAILTALDWRTGLTLASICLYFALLTIHLESGIYVILAASVIFIDGWAPNRSPDDVPFRLSIGHIYIMEFAVYGLLAAYLLGRAFGSRPDGAKRLFVPTPLDTPLMVFAALLPIFAIYGLVLGNTVKEAIGYHEWRSLFMAIVFYFLITTIAGTREKALRLFWWFLALDTVIGLYSLALYFLGSDGPFPLVLGTGPVGEGPLNYTFMFAALCAISWLLYCGEINPWKRNLIVLTAVVPVLNVLLSEKRDPQVSLVLGLVVLTWRIPFRKKLKWAGSVAGAVIFLLMSVVGASKQSTGVEKSASRYTELVEFVKNPDLTPVVGDTLTFHIFDLVDSFNSVRLRPIFGYGFGGQFQRELTSLVGGDLVEPGIVHDQYLDFCVKMGAVGLVAFLWVLFRFFAFSYKAIPRSPVLEHDAISLGFFSAMWASTAFEVWTTSWRGNTKMPIVFLLSFALVVCLLRRSRRDLARP